MKSRLGISIFGAIALAAFATAANAQTRTVTQFWNSTNGDFNLNMVPTADGVSLGQISSIAGTPSIASGACGTSTNGSVAGTDQAGAITIGAAATTTCTVSFSKTLAAAPKSCVLFPANAAAADAPQTIKPYVSSITAAQFVVTGAALANTKYNFICL